MHPWHDIPIPTDIDEWFPVVVETPADSAVKYVIDKRTGFLRIKRILSSAMHYPANYGFIPRSLADDGEGLDVLVLGQHPLAPLSIVRARAIGFMEMSEAGCRDHKVVAVHIDDPVVADYHHINDLPEHLLSEMHRFFEDYRALEHVATSVGAFQGPEHAVRVVRESLAAYQAR